MILLLDNYDSFTYNLYQLLINFDNDVRTFRSDKISIKEIKKLNPDYIVLSPGPGIPKDAGIFIDTVKTFIKNTPILGVCLGHQAILSAFNVPIVKAKNIFHGKIDTIRHNGKSVFNGIKNNIKVTRYHSLVAKESDIPNEFEVLAKSRDGEVMAIKHKKYKCVGVQFHPESVGTEGGINMLKNFFEEDINTNALIEKAMKKVLSFQESYKLMKNISIFNTAQIASILTIFNMRKVSYKELAGFAKVLKDNAEYFPKPNLNEKRLDVCGTGGSKMKTFNVSTISSIVLSALGVNIVKHGNRAVTSQSGSMDLLEKLGFNLDIDNEEAYDFYKKNNFTYLYAPKYHKIMKYVSETRKSLKFKTIFNLIGPLSNPAHATYQLIGVYDKKYLKQMCKALKYLGIKRAMVVSSKNGLDEISIFEPTYICELKDGKFYEYIFDFSNIDNYVKYEDIKYEDNQNNEKIALEILNGNDIKRAKIVCINAGAALYLYGKANSIKEGYYMALESIKNKKALKKLEKLVKVSDINV
ncbi:bifunctional protein TrpGD [Tepiditoga spiralis]|uniref:Anthranilate phosphoribosyltransferase n=1 Tax=Tepiditoga spiralis TaxID=2108365 RepID=A0A7G1G766_9BACT|nr:anthranilate phosphoribosyltransferase [Tepiditoga spiralis]BBE31014.1 bifunctional protein TrpGD [Tepiditoga spiralis]